MLPSPEGESSLDSRSDYITIKLEVSVASHILLSILTLSCISKYSSGVSNAHFTLHNSGAEHDCTRHQCFSRLFEIGDRKTTSKGAMRI